MRRPVSSFHSHLAVVRTRLKPVPSCSTVTNLRFSFFRGSALSRIEPRVEMTAGTACLATTSRCLALRANHVDGLYSWIWRASAALVIMGFLPRKGKEYVRLAYLRMRLSEKNYPLTVPALLLPSFCSQCLCSPF